MSNRFNFGLVIIFLIAALVLFAGCAGALTSKRAESASGLMLVLEEGHKSTVGDLTFALGGEILVSGGSGGTIKLWDVRTGSLIRNLQGHKGWVESVTAYRGGDQIISGDRDGRLNLWDIKTGRLLRRISTDCYSLEASEISADEKYLAAVCSSRGGIDIVDMETGSSIRMLKGHSRGVEDVSFSPDGRILASASHDTTIILWNFRTGKIVNSLKGHTEAVVSVSFSPDGRQLASSGYDETIRIWNVGDGKLIRTIEPESGNIYALSYSPDGELLVSGDRNGDLRLWNPQDGSLIRTLESKSSSLIAVSFSPDGALVAAGGADGFLHIFDVASGELLKSLKGMTKETVAFEYNENGGYFAVGDYKNRITRWDIAENRMGPAMKVKMLSRTTTSHDGRYLAAIVSRQVSVWDTGTGEEVFAAKYENDTVWQIAVSGAANVLAVSIYDKVVELWDIEAKKLLGQLPEEFKTAKAMVFRPDGKVLAVTWEKDYDKQLAIIDPKTLKITNVEFDEDFTFSDAIAFVGDGKTLAAGGFSGEIRFVDTDTGRVTAKMTAIYSMVDIITFARGQNTMALVNLDYETTILVRDPGSELGDWRKIRTLEKQPYSIKSVFFSPDGKTLCVYCEDQKVRFFDIEEGVLVATLVLIDSENWIMHTPDGYFDSTTEAMQYLKWAEGLTTYGLEKYKDKYHRPGLLNMIMTGQGVG